MNDGKCRARAAMVELAGRVEAMRRDILFADGEGIDILTDDSEASAMALQAIAQLEVAQRTFQLAAYAVDREA